MEKLTASYILDSEYLEASLKSSIEIAKTFNGHNDPNFKRIHHYNHHITSCIKELMGDNCKVFCEIGTHFGHSVCNVLSSNYDSKYITIDLFLPGKTIASDCKVKDVYALAKSNVDMYNINNKEVHIIKGNSQLDETVNKVNELAPEGIDLLFIDGDHTYNGVMTDFEKYFPLVNKGGVIIFDDYLPYNFKGIKRQCPVAVNNIVTQYANKINVIGLLEDNVGANKIRGLKHEKNIDFIIQKL